MSKISSPSSTRRRPSPIRACPGPSPRSFSKALALTSPLQPRWSCWSSLTLEAALPSFPPLPATSPSLLNRPNLQSSALRSPSLINQSLGVPNTSPQHQQHLLLHLLLHHHHHLLHHHLLLLLLLLLLHLLNLLLLVHFKRINLLNPSNPLT